VKDAIQKTLINITLEWERAPAKGRFEFSRAQAVSGWIIVGWGTLSKEDFRVAFSSAGEMCRMCLALSDDGTPEDPAARVRFTDTKHPFEFAVRDVLRQENEELRLEDPGVKIVAEVDYFAML
jgi:hypothetical protein